MQAESSELESIRRQLQDARVESEATTAKTTMMAERMHQLDGEMERLQREVLANENEQQNLENSIAESENKKAELAQQTEALMAELNVISGGREEFTAKRIEGRIYCQTHRNCRKAGKSGFGTCAGAESTGRSRKETQPGCAGKRKTKCRIRTRIATA